MRAEKRAIFLTRSLVAALRAIDKKHNVVQIKHLIKCLPTKKK